MILLFLKIAVFATKDLSLKTHVANLFTVTFFLRLFFYGTTILFLFQLFVLNIFLSLLTSESIDSKLCCSLNITVDHISWFLRNENEIFFFISLWRSILPKQDFCRIFV